MFAVRFLVVSGALACGGALAQNTKPKTFSVNFQNVAWDDVLAWYAKETGLTQVTTVVPPGTFTFEPPKPNQRYTVVEIDDILNEALVPQKFILVRRKLTFFVCNPDDLRDPRHMYCPLEELVNRASAEVVQVRLPLPAGIEGAEAELKRLLTPFGSLVMLKKGTAVLVTDTARNVRRIKAALDELKKK